MHTHRKILLAALLLSADAAACPPGEWLHQGVGWQMCVPFPNAQDSASPQDNRQAVWSDRWGAIAVDTSPHGSVGFGAAAGLKRKGQAEKAALKACRNKGGARCEIKISYYNQCAALVWGNHSFNTTGAASEEEAKQLGMRKCTQSGEINCEIFYSECSIPVRIQ